MKRLLAVLPVLIVSACGNRGILQNCEVYGGTYPIQYVGAAIGRGELDLSVSPDRADLLLGRLTLWDETGSDAVIHLEGPGTCDRGTLRIRFGGGDHPDAAIKVLGGNFVGVPEPRLFEGLFGAWQVSVVIKETNETRALEGFARETFLREARLSTRENP